MSKSTRIYLEEDEFVKILKHSAGTGIHAKFSFGPGWVALTHTEGEPVSEAIKYLAQLRGITTENCDGAGI